MGARPMGFRVPHVAKHGMVNSKLPLHRVTDAANFVSSYAFTSGLTHGRNLELHVVGVIDAEVKLERPKMALGLRASNSSNRQVATS